MLKISNDLLTKTTDEQPENSINEQSNDSFMLEDLGNPDEKSLAPITLEPDFESEDESDEDSEELSDEDLIAGIEDDEDFAEESTTVTEESMTADDSLLTDTDFGDDDNDEDLTSDEDLLAGIEDDDDEEGVDEQSISAESNIEIEEDEQSDDDMIENDDDILIDEIDVDDDEDLEAENSEDDEDDEQLTENEENSPSFSTNSFGQSETLEVSQEEDDEFGDFEMDDDTDEEDETSVETPTEENIEQTSETKTDDIDFEDGFIFDDDDEDEEEQTETEEAEVVDANVEPKNDFDIDIDIDDDDDEEIEDTPVVTQPTRPVNKFAAMSKPAAEKSESTTEQSDLVAENERLKQQLLEMENAKLTAQIKSLQAQQNKKPSISLNTGVVQKQTPQEPKPTAVAKALTEEQQQAKRWQKYEQMKIEDLWPIVYKFMTAFGLKEHCIKPSLLEKEFGPTCVKKLERSYIIKTKDGYTC